MYNSITRILCLHCNEYLPATNFLRSPDRHGYEPACVDCRDRYKKPVTPTVDRIKHKSSWNPLIQCEICGKKRRVTSYPLPYNKEHPICLSCAKHQKPLRHPTYKTWPSMKDQRAKGLKHTYNMTLDDYQDLFLRQFGLCAICSNAPKNGKNLHVDHDHKTGKIRGLLCQHCNQMLGNAKDNITTLKNAIKYLKS